MEQLGPNSAKSNRFWICLPRSYTGFASVTKYLQTLSSAPGLDAKIRECHPRQALELLDGGSAEIALIRYCTEYQDYFSEQAQQRELCLKLLNQTEYRPVFHDRNPLTQKELVYKEDLAACTEILHRDTFYPATAMEDTNHQIHTTDRMAQIQLLQTLPNTYLWAEPLPEGFLYSHALAQRPCADGGTRYQNALVYKPQCAMSETEKGFLKWLQKQ